jgi:hypothetical protein
MTGQQLYKFLHDWVVSVVPNGTVVIQAYLNASPPTTGTYLAIEDDNDWQPFGRADVVQDTTDEGVNYSYIVKPVFWEVRGTGDLLRAIRESLELQSTQALFQTAGVGILRASDQIISLPYLSTETQFIREKRWQPSFTVNNYTTDATPSVATAQLVTTLGH